MEGSSLQFAGRWISASGSQARREPLVRGLAQLLGDGPDLVGTVRFQTRLQSVANHLLVDEAAQRVGTAARGEDWSNARGGLRRGACADAALQQHVVAPFFGALATQDHLAEEASGRGTVLVTFAGVHQAQEYVRAHGDAVFARELLHPSASVAHAVRLDHHLRDDRHAILGRLELVLFHPLQDARALFHEAVLRATIQKGVVEDVVRL
mmetsp:Transcript_63413/g.176440  ORF Transcript_63413/g.176440 Transcript_63413/m.176440 type:complete len:209 (-) Transcript_63413:1350-1976(-)